MAVFHVHHHTLLDLWAEDYDASILKKAHANRIHILPRRGFYCLLAVILMLVGLFYFCMAVLEARYEAQSNSIIKALVVDTKKTSDGCVAVLRYSEIDGSTATGELKLNSCLALGESIDVKNTWDEATDSLKLEPVDELNNINNYTPFVLGGFFIVAAMFFLYLVINELRIGFALSTSGIYEEATIIGFLHNRSRRANKIVPVYKIADDKFLVDYAHHTNKTQDELKELLGSKVRIGINNGYFLLLDRILYNNPTWHQGEQL